MVRKVSLLVLAITMLVSSAHAGVTPGHSVLIVNVGYASGKSVTTGENVDGGIIGLDYQKLGWNGGWSGGFSIGYGEIQQTITGTGVGADTTEVDNTISSVPIYLGGKYWIGSGENRFQGYVGLAFGMYFSELTTSATGTVGKQPVSGSYTSESTLGFGLGVPVGVSFSLGESILLTANYTLNWLWDNEFLDNDIMNNFSLGLGFRFGG